MEKDYFSDVRTLIHETCSSIKNIRLGDAIFQDVNLPSAILITTKNASNPKKLFWADIAKQSIIDRVNLLENNKNLIVFDTQTPDISKSFVAKNSLFRKGVSFPLIELYDQTMGVKVYQVGKGKPKQTWKIHGRFMES